MVDVDEFRRLAGDMGSSIVGDRLREAAARITELEAPYRNVDAMDWDHLFRMIPDSGHGQFWKAVMTEVRASLETKKS